MGNMSWWGGGLVWVGRGEWVGVEGLGWVGEVGGRGVRGVCGDGWGGVGGGGGHASFNYQPQ